MTSHNTLRRTLKLTARRIVLVGITLATAGLILSSAPASAMKSEPNGTITTHERGNLLECRGNNDGLKAYASLYENNLHGSFVQIVLGGPDSGRGNGKNIERKLLKDGKVRAQVKVDGFLAKVAGTATKMGQKRDVHEELDDAGYHVTMDGTHRSLVNKLVLRYKGKRVPLTCDPAFKYNLTVVKEPIT